jgi:hypothetical protein
VLGAVSLSIEATLAVPQAWRNYRTGTTKGLSWFLVFTWFAGDLAKLALFVSRGSPLQFIYCAVAQIGVDVVVMAQIATLGDGDAPQARTVELRRVFHDQL